ncbi:uncharacterized protein LOC133890320 [Phragmites australis]|uniref:uncharacterized protein LOC133890320 n=1 Tax=Phragmites australis TaxID=29695 RepID=UPI002D77EC7B|nr:uncharacterized protein LOC133890320 [Phragmites australis]
MNDHSIVNWLYTTISKEILVIVVQPNTTAFVVWTAMEDINHPRLQTLADTLRDVGQPRQRAKTGVEHAARPKLQVPPLHTRPYLQDPLPTFLAARSYLLQGITLSGLLNFIDGLWSTSGEERIIIFTTNYKDHLDPALLRPGRMDMHIYMGYCGWEAFKTLARNYFLVDDHALFPVIQELLMELEVTPAEVLEMLLRSEDCSCGVPPGEETEDKER